MTVIEPNSIWRHKLRPQRKIRVVRVDEVPGDPEQLMISFDVSDPEQNMQPWRDSSVLGTYLFQQSYEPVEAEILPDRRELAEKIVAELIQTTEKVLDEQAVTLRVRVDDALRYIGKVDVPNIHTLNHIRRILTGDQ